MPPTAPPLEQMWPLINNLDWADDSFSREKAYVCAVFSECAYWCIPRWELDRDGRVKLVPCDAYQELVRSAEATGAIIGEALRKQDFPQPIIIARRYAVAVILPIRPVIIVAIRGTKYLYDWLINLNVAKVTANLVTRRAAFIADSLERSAHASRNLHTDSASTRQPTRPST